VKAIHSRSGVAQAPRDFLYVATGAPLGLTWFIVLVTALAVGIGTAVVVVGGLLTAAVAVALTRGLAVACTTMAAGLLAPDERALLAARVDALETTRAGAVESADARLRRLERDLHDRAQHRLAYIATELDRARTKLADDPDSASELLVRAHEESKRAMVDLRGPDQRPAGTTLQRRGRRDRSVHPSDETTRRQFGRRRCQDLRKPVTGLPNYGAFSTTAASGVATWKLKLSSRYSCTAPLSWLS